MGPSAPTSARFDALWPALTQPPAYHVFDGLRTDPRMNDDTADVAAPSQTDFFFSFNLLPMFTRQTEHRHATSRHHRRSRTLVAQPAGRNAWTEGRLNHRSERTVRRQQRRVAITAPATQPQTAARVRRRTDRQPRLVFSAKVLSFLKRFRERNSADHHHGHPRCRHWPPYAGPRHRVRRQTRNHWPASTSRRRADGDVVTLMEGNADRPHRRPYPPPATLADAFAKPAFARTYLKKETELPCGPSL